MGNVGGWHIGGVRLVGALVLAATMTAGGAGAETLLDGPERGDAAAAGVHVAAAERVRRLGPNLVRNGSFEQIEGMMPEKYGYKGRIAAWRIGSGAPAEVVRSGWVHMPTADGDYFVDMGTIGTRLIDMSQSIGGVREGQTYELSFAAGQWRQPSPVPDETMKVFWNGELLATIRPETIRAYEQYRFEVVGGGGDNTLRFQGIGTDEWDSQGVVLDNVCIQEVLSGDAGAQAEAPEGVCGSETRQDRADAGPRHGRAADAS